MIYEDTNGDGIQNNGELGLGGAIVTLTSLGPKAPNCNPCQTTTATDGSYTLSVLPGEYSIVVTHVDNILSQGTFNTDKQSDKLIGLKVVHVMIYLPYMKR
jgi:uncharacterized membrane protein